MRRDELWRQFGATEDPARVAEAVLLRGGAARLERFDPQVLQVAFAGALSSMREACHAG